MLQSPVRINIPSILNEIINAIESKKIEELRNCIDKLGTVNYSLASLVDFLCEKLNKDKEDLKLEIILDTIRFGNVAILNYLADEIKIDLNVYIEKLYIIAVKGKLHEFIEELSQYKTLQEDALVSGLFMAIAQDDEASINIITRTLKNTFDDDALNDIINLDDDAKAVLAKKLNISSSNNLETIQKSLEAVEQNCQKLNEGLSTLPDPQNGLQLFSIIKEQTQNIKEHLNKYAKLSAVMSYNHQIAVLRLQSAIQKQYQHSEDLENILSIIQSLNLEKGIKDSEANILNDIVNDDFVNLCLMPTEQDNAKFIATLSKLENNGLSLQKMDNIAQKLCEQSLYDALVADSLACKNAELSQYIINDLKLPLTREQLPYAVIGNQSEIVNKLLTTYVYSIDELEDALDEALLLKDATCKEILIQKIRDLYPEEINELLRLLPDVEKLKRQKQRELNKNYESLFSKVEVDLKKLLSTFEKQASSLTLIIDTHRLLNIVTALNAQIQKREQLLMLPIIAAKLIALKLHACAKQHANLESETQELHNLTKIFDLDELDELTPELTFAQIPEKLREQMLRVMGEDAIDELTNEEHGLYHQIKTQYQLSFDNLCPILMLGDGSQDIATLNCYPVLKTLEDYLISQFSSENLKTTFDPNLSEEQLKAYYQNKFHTAWRYIFARPNPWISPDAKWAENGASKIQPEDFERIAYFWLASSDDKAPCIDGFTLETRKEHFVDTLGQFAREYNNEGPIDDLEGDKPTCDLGIRKRAAQLLIGHPIVTQVKELNPDIFLKLIQAWFIAENENHKTLFSDLKTLSEKEINQIYEALNNWIINCGDIDRVDTLILSLFKQRDPALEHVAYDFGEAVGNDFGEPRLTKIKVDYQDRHYEHYFHFFGEVMKDPLSFFSTEIYNKVKSLKESFDNAKVSIADIAVNAKDKTLLSSFENTKNLKRKQNADAEVDENIADAYKITPSKIAKLG